MRGAIGLLICVMLTACASHEDQPRMVYNCDVELTNEYGVFHVSPYTAQWDMHWPNGMFAQLQYRIWLDPAADESVHPFTGLDGHSDFYVGFAREFEPRHGHSRYFVARSGETSVRTNIRFGTSEFIDSDQGAALLRTGTDLDLTLYDEADQALQHMVLPRTFLLGMEQTFRETAEQVRNNVMDKANRCPLEEQETITVA
jgi:hypothetical protein